MKKFETPEVEIEKFQVEDVLTASAPSETVPEFNDENAGQWQS